MSWIIEPVGLIVGVILRRCYAVWMKIYLAYYI